VAFLERRFPELSTFTKSGAPQASSEEVPATFDPDTATWKHRRGVQERVQRKLTDSIPDEPVRSAALQVLGFAIENADEERAGAWYLRETDKGLRLLTGRLLACAIAGSKMRLSIIGPLDEYVRDSLGGEVEIDDEFKAIPGGVLISFPIEHAAKALEVLKGPLTNFIDATWHLYDAP
jgi:hypothetical protein